MKLAILLIACTIGLIEAQDGLKVSVISLPSTCEQIS